MSKNLSEKYYQENKERLQRKAHEIFLKKKKEKSKNKVVNKNLSENETQKVVEYCKKHYRMTKKIPTYNHKKHLF